LRQFQNVPEYNGHAEEEAISLRYSATRQLRSALDLENNDITRFEPESTCIRMISSVSHKPKRQTGPSRESAEGHFAKVCWRKPVATEMIAALKRE